VAPFCFSASDLLSHKDEAFRSHFDLPGKVVHQQLPVDCERSGMRRHKYQHDQALGAMVLHSVFFARTRVGSHAGQELSALGSDLHEAFPLEHIVNLVGALMLMRCLFLAGFEAINVAEHALGFKEINLLELLG
jgi:hypothetical protein